MPLNGGAITINATDDQTTENILTQIINHIDTSIDMLHEGGPPEYVYMLEFNNKVFSNFFTTTGTSVKPKVLIMKILTHKEITHVDETTHKISYSPDITQHVNEVEIHKYLRNSGKNHYPICPSFLFSKMTKLGKNKDDADTLEKAIYTILSRTIQNIEVKEEQEVIKDGVKITEKVTQRKTVQLYTRLKEDSVKKLKSRDSLTKMIPDFNFDDLTQTIIFMEYAACVSLYNLTRDEVSIGRDINYMSNIHGMPLPFAEAIDPRETDEKIKERKAGFACFVVLYISILLLNQGIIHGDLHAGNVLICRSKDGIIDAVVIDFGRAAFTSNVSIYTPRQLYNNKYKQVLPETTRTIFDETAMFIDETEEPTPQITDIIGTNMTSYFDTLITKKEFVKAAIASTMYCSPNYAARNYVSVFGNYMSALLEPKQTYLPIFKYATLSSSYNFNKLIEEALVARKKFYDNDFVDEKGTSFVVNKLPDKDWLTERARPLWSEADRLAVKANLDEAKKKSINPFLAISSTTPSLFRRMFSTKPSRAPTTPRAGQDSLMAGGNGIGRRYYNYKKTEKRRVNKIYSKKTKRLKIKTKRLKIKTKRRK